MTYNNCKSASLHANLVFHLRLNVQIVTVLPFCSPHAVLFPSPHLYSTLTASHTLHCSKSSHLLSIRLVYYKDSSSSLTHCSLCARLDWFLVANSSSILVMFSAFCPQHYSAFALLSTVCLFQWLCGDLFGFLFILLHWFHCVCCVDFHLLDISFVFPSICCKLHLSHYQLYMYVCWIAIWS